MAERRVMAKVFLFPSHYRSRRHNNSKLYQKLCSLSKIVKMGKIEACVIAVTCKIDRSTDLVAAVRPRCGVHPSKDLDPVIRLFEGNSLGSLSEPAQEVLIPRR